MDAAIARILFQSLCVHSTSLEERKKVKEEEENIKAKCGCG